MIYICVASQNDAATVGLMLWKIRNVLREFPREYHILVADDCSDDETQDILEPYQRSLPLTVVRNAERKGYAASVEMLLRNALRRSDRPKRDCAITIGGEFSVSPIAIPEYIRRFESGADVIVGELDNADLPFSAKLVKRSAPWLLRPGVHLPGVTDLFSRTAAFRLITLRKLLRGQDGEEVLLTTDGHAAHIELVARTAALARQFASIRIDRGPGKSPDIGKFSVAMELFRAGRKLRVPVPEATLQRFTEAAAAT